MWIETVKSVIYLVVLIQSYLTKKPYKQSIFCSWQQNEGGVRGDSTHRKNSLYVCDLKVDRWSEPHGKVHMLRADQN